MHPTPLINQGRKSMKKVLLKATVVAAAAAVLLTGCSSSSSSKKSTTPSSGSGNTASSGPKATGAPIVLGTICGCTGPQASSLALVKDAADAWAKSVNDNGGINGHPVKLIVKDDASNPATGLQQAKELVEKDKVIAIVGEVDLVDASWAEYVASKGVPVVGGLSIDAPFSTNPDFFASGPNVAVLQLGIINEMKKQGKQHLGVLYCAEAPVCAQLEGLSKAAANIVGGVNVTAGKVAATSPTYTSQCLAMKSAGADTLNIASNSEAVLRVAEGCAKLGFKPTIVEQGGTIAVSWLTNSVMDGAIITLPNANYVDESVPAVKAFLDAMDKYHSGDRKSAQFGFNLIEAWVGGKLFEAAAKAANIGPSSTPADVKKGLYALKDETLGGLAPPLNFVAGKPAFPSCYFVASISNGKFSSPGGTKATCLTAEQTAALGKVLSG
jgi:branched-chain amino acid transport system substrate-binding protein